MPKDKQQKVIWFSTLENVSSSEIHMSMYTAYASKFSKELEWTLVRRMKSNMLERGKKNKKVNLSLSAPLL